MTATVTNLAEWRAARLAPRAAFVDRNNVVQHARTQQPNNPPPPNTLLEGELAFEMAEPRKVWLGVPTTIDPDGQVLLLDTSRGGNVTISDTPPANPHEGDLWWSSAPGDLALYVWYIDPTSAQWVPATPTGAGTASVSIDDVPPANPQHGDLWWDSTDLHLLIYYRDPTSEQWVVASPPGIAEAPRTGELYMRNGLTNDWDELTLIDGGQY